MTHPPYALIPRFGSPRRASARCPMGLLFVSLVFFMSLPVSAYSGQWTHFENHSDIRALYEDGDTLWVGTNGGVLLVSVLTGEVVSTIDATSGLASNSVRAFCERGGRVYVGTDEGLAVCRRVRGGGVSCEPAGPYRDIRHVSVGASGTLYIGTFGHGVAEVGGRRTTWITTADSLLDDKVFAVRESGGSGVFYATSMGLCARTDNAWVSYQAGAGLPRGEVRDIVGAAGQGFVAGPAGREFYVLVAGRGVYLFDGRRGREVSARGFFREDDVAGIAVTGAGTLWAAGRYGRVARYRDGVWTPVGEGDKDIANTHWRCVHVGRSGIVYFGSSDGLVAAADERNIRKVSVPSGLPNGRIGPAAEDPMGRKYIAVGTYLLSIKDDVSGFTVEKDFGSVLAIAISPDSVVWVNGRWGLYRKEKEPDRWVEVDPDIDPRPPLFRSLAFDSSGHLWAGAESGEIFRFDGDVWVRWADRGELCGAAVERLIIDRRGTVWALSGSGVYALDGSGWVRFEAGRFDSTGVVDLTADPSGNPVVVTPRRLWRFTENGGWQPVPIATPADPGEYRGIGFDRRGRSYLVTEKGIALVDGDGGSGRWLGSEDGLRGREVTSILLDGDGFLWVGFRRDGISRILLENLW